MSWSHCLVTTTVVIGYMCPVAFGDGQVLARRKRCTADPWSCSAAKSLDVEQEVARGTGHPHWGQQLFHLHNS